VKEAQIALLFDILVVPFLFKIINTQEFMKAIIQCLVILLAPSVVSLLLFLVILGEKKGRVNGVIRGGGSQGVRRKHDSEQDSRTLHSQKSRDRGDDILKSVRSA